MSLEAGRIVSSNSLPRLQSANQHQSSSTPPLSEVNKEYRSGAIYRGNVCNNLRCGRGVFTWPTGARYDGEFSDNMRNGQGIQEWPDGSRYEGSYLDDYKHGSGCHIWANGEMYQGSFFKDHCHGYGVYSWPDGSQYCGTFYMDRREGYGTLANIDGSTFQGLYRCGERFGPGVFTYPDNRQDVGLWHRERLVRLLTALDEPAFTISSLPNFNDMELHHPTVAAQPPFGTRDVIETVIKRTTGTVDDDFMLSDATLARKILSDSMPLQSLAIDLEAYDAAFSEAVCECQKNVLSAANDIEIEGNISAVEPIAGDETPDVIKSSSRPKQLSKRSNNSVNNNTITTMRSPDSALKAVVDMSEVWNATPACIRMQSHVLWHKEGQISSGFDVDSVLRHRRSCFGEPGSIETASFTFLKAAAAGDVLMVTKMLREGLVNVDVADSKGQTALIGATVSTHLDVINVLLDNGADVNKLTDEGVSALAATYVNLYPPASFKLDEHLKVGVWTNPRNLSSVVSKVKHANIAKLAEKPELSEAESNRIKELRQEYRRDSTRISGTGFDELSIGPERVVGKLVVRRAERSNVEELISSYKLPLLSATPSPDGASSVPNIVQRPQSCFEKFKSRDSVRGFPTTVTDQQIAKYAESLSHNDMVVSGPRARSAERYSEGTVRRLAVEKSQMQKIKRTGQLLLLRGADPNASRVPMPVLLFAVLSADVEAVRQLLLKGASPNVQLPEKMRSLYALHVAVLLPGSESVEITRLLLDALADPDVVGNDRRPSSAASTSTGSASANLPRGVSTMIKDVPTEEASFSTSKIINQGGQSALHLACARQDNIQYASEIVNLLLEHHACPAMVLPIGHSPLSLAILSGNDSAVENLLKFGANPRMALGGGLHTALCVSTLIENETRRLPNARIPLIDKLVEYGADVLAQVPVGPSSEMGTVVDYVYHLYGEDKRITNTPFNALTPEERITFVARRDLMQHLADLLREKAIDAEKARLDTERSSGQLSRNPSAKFVYTRCGAQIQSPDSASRRTSGSATSLTEVRRPLLRYCYDCGRSLFVKLTPCTRCNEVYYCSKPCMTRSWELRHEKECLRVPDIPAKSKTSAEKLSGTSSASWLSCTVLNLTAGSPTKMISDGTGTAAAEAVTQNDVVACRGGRSCKGVASRKAGGIGGGCKGGCNGAERTNGSGFRGGCGSMGSASRGGRGTGGGGGTSLTSSNDRRRINRGVLKATNGNDNPDNDEEVDFDDYRLYDYTSSDSEVYEQSLNKSKSAKNIQNEDFFSSSKGEKNIVRFAEPIKNKETLSNQKKHNVFNNKNENRSKYSTDKGDNGNPENRSSLKKQFDKEMVMPKKPKDQVVLEKIKQRTLPSSFYAEASDDEEDDDVNNNKFRISPGVRVAKKGNGHRPNKAALQDGPTPVNYHDHSDDEIFTYDDVFRAARSVIQSGQTTKTKKKGSEVQQTKTVKSKKDDVPKAATAESAKTRIPPNMDIGLLRASDDNADSEIKKKKLRKKAENKKADKANKDKRDMKEKETATDSTVVKKKDHAKKATDAKTAAALAAASAAGKHEAVKVLKAVQLLKDSNFGVEKKIKKTSRQVLPTVSRGPTWFEGLPPNCYIGNYSYI